MSFKKKDVLKIVILGPQQVGKRALIQQFVHRRWSADSNTFDTFDVPKKLIAVEEKQVTLELYPVDCIETMTSTLNGASCDGCLLSYDISSKASFDGLLDLLTEFLQHSLISSQMSLPPIVIIGNKYDLGSTKREVQKEDAMKWSQGLNAALAAKGGIVNLSQAKFELYEVSAKTADQIDTVFYRIARLALNLNHNMFTGTVSAHQLSALQRNLCLVDGCLLPRTYRGYCTTHSSGADRGQVVALKPEEVLLPTLFALNKSVNNYNPRQSPYHLALLGSIRQLIISITSDKERTFQLLPQNENDVYKTAAQVAAMQRSPKSDRGSIIALDQSKPIALPKILYNSILDLNKTQMDLLAIVTPPKDNKKASKDDKDRVMTTTIPWEQFSNDNAPQRHRLPILDISVTTNIKNVPPHYTVIQKSFTGRKADLNSGSGGKDVYICVLRDSPDDTLQQLQQQQQNLLDDMPTQEQRWNVYANGIQKPIETTIVTTSELDGSGVIIEGSCLSEELLKRAQATMAAQFAPSQVQKKPAPVPKKKGKPKPEIAINLLSQLLPITSVNLALILPRQREDAPFGFEIASNMPDSLLANLNAGTQSETQLYFALHRAGPGPDYNLYARDLFGEGEIDKGYIEGHEKGYNPANNARSSFAMPHDHSSFIGNGNSGPRDSVHNLDFHALARNQSVLAQPLISAASNNIIAAQTLTPNDIYTLSKSPLTILTEDSRSMVPNYPLGGSRGPGAPIVDVNVIFPQRGEVCPPDWHELNVTLLHHHATLNSGTDGNEVKLAFKLDVEPVLHKVYRPFLEVLTTRSNEANTVGIDNQVLIQFTQFCAILTCCIYSSNVYLVLDALNAVKNLLKPERTVQLHQSSDDTSTNDDTQGSLSQSQTGKPAAPPPPPPKNVANLFPPQIFNAFVHTICDAAPMLLGILHRKERTLLLELLEIVIEKTYNILSGYTVMRIVDIFVLLRSTDMTLASEFGPEGGHHPEVQGGDFLNQTYSSSYVLQHSLRLLKPIVTSANQSMLKHHSTDIHQSPMARLDPNGSFPRLMELILRQHVFDDGQVLLGRKKDLLGSHSTLHNPASTPLLTKSPQIIGRQPPVSPISPILTSTNANPLDKTSPLPAPPTLPTIITTVQNNSNNNIPSLMAPDVIQEETIDSNNKNNNNNIFIEPDPSQSIFPITTAASPIPPPIHSLPQPHVGTKKLSQAEIVQKSRSQEEVSTIINNINNNPYDMCAGLMRYLADQVISSKITDQEIGRLQRRTYGSQPLGDLACITERLINDHHTQRNWLLDPPVGYSLNPTLRTKQAPTNANSPNLISTPALAPATSLGTLTLPRSGTGGLINSNTDPSSPNLLGLPTFDSLSTPLATNNELPFTFNQLAQQQTPSITSENKPSLVNNSSINVPELTALGSVTGSTIHEDQPANNTIINNGNSTPVTGPNSQEDKKPTQLSQLLSSRNKNLTVDVNSDVHGIGHSQSTPSVSVSRNLITAATPGAQQRHSVLPAQLPRPYPYTTYTRVFHSDPDLNPDGTPYQWRYFTLQHIKHETEADRRKRKKAEKARAHEVERMLDAMMLEEHKQELASRRMVIHNSQHLWSNNLIVYKAERILLSLIIYLCKLASSDADTNPLHASSVKSLIHINIMAYDSIGLAYKAASPYGVMAKDEMILRRVYALQLLHYILDKSDEFLKSNQASINVIRRYIVPAIINNTVTLVPSMFFISLKCFVILCEKYNTECQSEIGLLLNDVFLELLISSAAPVDFKVHIFELLELVLNTPSQIINLYQTQDNAGQRNVYEKLLQTVSVIILQTQFAKGDIGTTQPIETTNEGPSDRQLLFKKLGVSDLPLPVKTNPTTAGGALSRTTTDNDDPNAPTRIEEVVYQYTSSNDPKKSLQDIAAERLRKCALRLLMHHLHMLAQWTGVPALKRSLDATNALKLTCKSFLHVLICSESFPELFTTTPDYTNAIKVAAKKLQMFFEGLPHTASSRPYIQMPGILEEILRVEGEKALKQLLGLNSGLTRVNTTLTKDRLVDLTHKTKSMKDETNLKCVAKKVMEETLKAGISIASSQTTIAYAQQQYNSLNQWNNNSSLYSRDGGYSTLVAPTTPSNAQHVSKLITSPSLLGQSGNIGGNVAQTPTTNSARASGVSVKFDQLLKINGATGSNKEPTIIQDDFDMDGGYIETKLDGSANVPTLQQTFEKMGDEICLNVQKLLGDIPPTMGGLELGLDLGHYSAMDPYTISMVKNNPAFAMMLTSRSPLSKQRLEYQRVYKEASTLAKGESSLKKMLKFLHTKYPRWLTPYNIAQLLYQNPYISPVVVGDYLSSQDDTYFNSDQFAQLRTAYTNLIDLSGMPFISALRYYLTNGGFRMPGEGQKISRMVESFCQAFTRDNPDEFANVDIAGVVCYAAIMLNTELHNPSSQLIAKKNARPPMTLPQFITNILSVGPAGRRTDILSLVNIYIEISGQAIEWVGDDTNHDHFDTALTLEQLLGQAANGSNSQNNNAFNDDDDGTSDLTAQAFAMYQLQEAIKNQSKLRLLRRRALCDVRSVGPLSARNDVTSSTQIMSVLWSHVWPHYLRSIASKMDSSPFFSPASLRGGSGSGNNANGNNLSGIEHLKIDEVDYETLHMCIDCLAYGAAVSTALGDHDARKPFMRALAKIVFLETQCAKNYQPSDTGEDVPKDKKKGTSEDEILSHVLSPQLRDQLLGGEHYKQPWYTNLDNLSTHSPVLACKMLLSIASNTKTNISFQRRQQILRIMEREFGGRESINLSADTDRAFIRKAKLVKLSSSNKKQIYTFFLFNDLLIYAEEEGKDRYKIHQVLHLSLLRLVSLLHLTRPLEEKRQETIQKVLSLRDQLANNNMVANAHNNPQVQAQNAAIVAELNKITIPPQPPARFKIISPQKSFIIECVDEAEMTSWVSLIQDCITKLLVKRSDWCLKAKDAIKQGVLHPDLLGAKKITVDTKKNRVDNKEDIVMSVMDAKGNIAALNKFYEPDISAFQQYLKSVPKNTFPVSIERSLQLKKYATFSGSSAFKLTKLAQEGFASSTTTFCKLCLRPYAFRRGAKTCQHCGEDVCSDCTKSTEVLIQPMVKVRSIRACHACAGLLPAPNNEDGRGLIGDNQPIFQIGDDDDM